MLFCSTIILCETSYLYYFILKNLFRVFKKSYFKKIFLYREGQSFFNVEKLLNVNWIFFPNDNSLTYYKK